MAGSDAWLNKTGSGADRPSNPDALGRWERLFADLEAELAAAEDAEFAAEVADRARIEFAQVRLVDRLRAALGSMVTLTVVGGVGSAVVLQGMVLEVGPDWLLTAPTRAELEGVYGGADHATGVQALVRLGAVLTVRDLPASAAAPGSEGQVEARYDLRMVLRRLARDRSALVITLTSGTVIHGTLDRVGADFVDVAQHAPGEPRRHRSVQQRQTIPIVALVMLRTY